MDICLYRAELVTLGDMVMAFRDWVPFQKWRMDCSSQCIIMPENLLLGMENLLLPECSRF